LQEKDEIIKELQDKVLRAYAEVENVMARARREAESTRKYALQVCWVLLFTKPSLQEFDVPYLLWSINTWTSSARFSLFKHLLRGFNRIYCLDAGFCKGPTGRS
jgi:hypothetical protein